MHVAILGPLEVAADGERFEITGARLRTLMVRLALDAGRTVTVDALSRTLWPDDEPADPAHAIQSLVSRLRRVLPDRSVLRSVPDGYRLDLPAENVDALRFESLAHAGRRALRDGDAEGAAHRLREALGLWRGEIDSVRLTELRVTAIEDRVEAELATVPEPAGLVAELAELTATHPLRERPRVLLIRALRATGRHAEALTVLPAYQELLADELGADPGPEIQAAHLAVLRHEPSGRGAARGNLRAELTSFIGRAKERGWLAERLTDRRLVTLIGPGGAGKTRLATTVAADVADGFPGGVWLVELAPVTDPNDLPRAVGGALGLRDGAMLDAPRDPVGRLAEALPATETLILLDNCEHLIDAAARLAQDLLGRRPKLRMLATSREPLGVPGETLCPVPPLEVGGPPERSPAVLLFVDRAAATGPGFELTEADIGAVADICRRLDGLPLAIELAAATLRMLPVAELAARLGDRFRLLTGGSRTALPRHRTLAAVFAWSWDLLDEDEQRLARRLAVFPGSFTSESAQTVCGGERVFELLTALVDKSLLHTVAGTRFQMLETIREYSLERLAEAGETTPVTAAHAAHFLGLAERAGPHLRGRGQLPWLATLAAERDNLTAALHFARDTADADTAVRLATALGLFHTVRGEHVEAAGHLRPALAVPGAVSPRVRSAAVALHLFNSVYGATDRADVTAEHGLPEDGPVGALLEPAAALLTDDIDAGLAATARLLSHPDPWTRAMLHFIRAILLAGVGELGPMREALGSAAHGFRQAGERWGLATSLTFLAYIGLTVGEVEEPVEALEESIRLLGELGDDAVLQRVWLAETRARLGDAERARADLLALVAPGGTPAGLRTFAWVALGDLARHAGDLAEAASHYDAAEADAGSGSRLYLAMADCGQGHLAAAAEDLDEARRRFGEAFSLAVAAPDLPMAAIAAVGVARLRADLGDLAGAASVLGAAHALRGASDAFRPDVGHVTDRLRDSMGERDFRSAYEHGSGLDRPGALALIEDQVRRR